MAIPNEKDNRLRPGWCHYAQLISHDARLWPL